MLLWRHHPDDGRHVGVQGRQQLWCHCLHVSLICPLPSPFLFLPSLWSTIDSHLLLLPFIHYGSSYGAFWLSYAAILIPGFGIVPAYEGATIDPHALDNALGIFLLSWGIFTFILWIATLRATVALSSMFFVLTLTFLFLASGHLAHLEPGNYPTRVGGGLGIVTALLAWYNAAAGLYVPSATFVRLPVGPLGHPHSE